MNKRGAGISFIIVSVLLFIFRNSTHFLVAAIIAARNGSYSSGSFENALAATKSFTIIPEIVALVLGVIYLIWAEVEKE